jgi:hypothetical protein
MEIPRHNFVSIEDGLEFNGTHCLLACANKVNLLGKHKYYK